MEKALLEFLLRLRDIQEDYDGLGDTNVRDHMGKDLSRGFLRPEPNFKPSGEYGLDDGANELVADALAKFCKAARAAADKEGLHTFQQRVAAFQNPKVRTPGNGDYNDFFGYIEAHHYDENGNRLPPSKPKGPKMERRVYQFDWDGTLEDLQTVLNKQRAWKWKLLDDDGAEDPYLEAKPLAGARVCVREGFEQMDAKGKVSPPDFAFMSLLEAIEGQLAEVDDAFRGLLKKIKASRVEETDDYWW